MYHFVSEKPPQTLILPGSTTVPAHICQYLKQFQIEAIKFLHAHLIRNEFCVLNDESGLGKCATIAVLLNAVAKKKKCLIIVQNNDEYVDGWLFHFNVLTNLSATVINNFNVPADIDHNVYIIKWGDLRSIGDLNKCRFDYVIIDNRGQMLSNTFCSSMLLKNYEKKINILISSVDITADLKLVHNILHLGGRLDHQYEEFRAFETKFKLPNPKEIFNKKVDLEEYFRRREILSDFCKEFRLRRYRHQYENLLPLVENDRYKTNLEIWLNSRRTNSCIYTQRINLSSIENGSTIDRETEELYEQCRIKKHQKEQRIEPIVDIFNSKETLPSTSNVQYYEENTANDKEIILSMCNRQNALVENEHSEEAVIMSPLLISDSEADDEQEPLLRKMTTEMDRACDDVIVIDITSECKENNHQSEIATISTATTGKKRNVRSGKTEESAIEKKSLRSHCNKKKPKAESNKPKLNQVVSNDEIARLGEKCASTNNQQENIKVLKRDNEIGTPRSARCVKSTESSSKGNDNSTKQTKSRRLHNGSTKDAMNKIVTSAFDTPKTSKRSPRKRLITQTPTGVHLKETRSMQRLTRSSGKCKNKYMRCVALNIDMPTVRKKRNKKDESTTIQTEKQQANRNQENKTQKKSNNLTKDITSSNAVEKPSQMALLPSSSYEDIQCGQKLSLDTSSGESSCRRRQAYRRDNEFLIPPTPQYPILSQCPSLTTSLSLLPNTEIACLPQTNSDAHEVVVLSSSQEEESSLSSSSQSSQSRRTRALKHNRLITTSTQQMYKLPHSFGDLLTTKKNQINRSSKSPDLFSNCSDVGLTNTMRLNNINMNNNNNASNLNQSPFEGFKIFGSEVKQLQQAHASSGSKRVDASATAATRKVRERSCLDILEKMFESNANGTKRSTSLRTTTKQSRARTKVSIIPSVETISLVNTTQQHDKNAQQTLINEDEIFEISNNGTFGSLMRINSNGNISPVQHQHQQALGNGKQTTQHNKITNYLISSTPVEAPAEPTIKTPTKSSATPQSSGTLQQRQTPKSKSVTPQATKLTKWFLRNNANYKEDNNNNDGRRKRQKHLSTEMRNKLESKEARTPGTKRSTKRRRLSFKN